MYFSIIFPILGHMDEVHGKGNSDEMIKCDLCDYTTTLKRNYRKHVRQMHTKREKLLLCDQCNLRFELPYQLKDHKDIVHEGNSKKLQSCDQCDKKFRYPHQVKDHKNLVHLGKLIHIVQIFSEGHKNLAHLPLPFEIT